MIEPTLGLIQQGCPDQRGEDWGQVSIDVTDAGLLQWRGIIAACRTNPRGDLAAKPQIADQTVSF